MTIRRRIPEIALGWDSGDKYGSTMAWWFGCAIALDAADEAVPDHWEWSGRSPQGSHADLCEDEFEATSLTAAVDAGELTWDDVRHFGNVFQRYRELLGAAGLDY